MTSIRTRFWAILGFFGLWIFATAVQADVIAMSEHGVPAIFTGIGAQVVIMLGLLIVASIALVGGFKIVALTSRAIRKI